MTKEQYFELKGELKELARLIKAAKPEHRQAQRDLSLFQNKNGSFNDYYHSTISSAKWEEIRPKHEELSKKEYNLFRDLQAMKTTYRHKHIVYCFARGKTLNQIEPKVRKGNEADTHLLQTYMKMYDVREPLVLSA
jgi:hypothetical protein